MTIRDDIAALEPLRTMQTPRGDVQVVKEINCSTCDGLALICRGKRDLYIRCKNGCGTTFNAALKVQSVWLKWASNSTPVKIEDIQAKAVQQVQPVASNQPKNLLQWLLNAQIIAP